jgi:hypothetical protein
LCREHQQQGYEAGGTGDQGSAWLAVVDNDLELPHGNDLRSGNHSGEGEELKTAANGCRNQPEDLIQPITKQQKGEKIMAMTVEIKGNKLCIEIDLEKPTPSSSGKTMVVASSRGNAVTTAMVDGKPVTIGLNAYIKP